MALLRPGGIARPGPQAINKGLSFALDFSDPSMTPWVRRTTSSGAGAALTGVLVGSAIRDTLPAGIGMVGNGYWGSTGAGNTYALNPTAGTMLVALVADHNPTDGAAHMIAHFGNPAFPTGPAVEMVRFNDGNFYFGIISTSNKRMAVSAVGKYAVGDVFTVGTTWDPGGQVAYCKGLAIGSNASTGLGDTSGSDVSIGELIGSNWKWATSQLGGILYVLIFDRALTTQEMQLAERDLWWWVNPAPFYNNMISYSSGSLIIPRRPMIYRSLY